MESQQHIKILRKNGRVPAGYLMLSKYAQRIDVDRAHVSRAVKNSGVIEAVKKGRNIYINVGQADKHFGFQDARPATRKRPPNSAALKSKKGKADCNIVDPGDLEDIDFESPPSMNESSATLSKRYEYERARKLKIKNDLDEGETILRQPVIDNYFKVARNVRDAMEVIPGRVASKLEGKKAHDIEQVLLEEIKKALSNLTEDIVETC